MPLQIRTAWPTRIALTTGTTRIAVIVAVQILKGRHHPRLGQVLAGAGLARTGIAGGAGISPVTGIPCRAGVAFAGGIWIAFAGGVGIVVTGVRVIPFIRVAVFFGFLLPRKIQGRRGKCLEELELLRGHGPEHAHGLVREHIDHAHGHVDDPDLAEGIPDDNPEPLFEALGPVVLGVDHDVVHGHGAPDADHGQRRLQVDVLRVGLGDLPGHVAEGPLEHAEAEIRAGPVRGVEHVLVDLQDRLRPLGHDGVVQKTDLHVGVRPGVDGLALVNDPVLFQGTHALRGFDPGLALDADDGSNVGFAHGCSP
ncbi:hypothetical protein SAMN06295888_104204 [Desulfonatronum zhilinae]|nr:hypothetical protein SAMN06295888_104204 [Desulfonatronum zhilinae]